MDSFHVCFITHPRKNSSQQQLLYYYPSNTQYFPLGISTIIKLLLNPIAFPLPWSIHVLITLLALQKKSLVPITSPHLKISFFIIYIISASCRIVIFPDNQVFWNLNFLFLFLSDVLHAVGVFFLQQLSAHHMQTNLNMRNVVSNGLSVYEAKLYIAFIIDSILIFFST